jgi:hypothetical protein
MWYDLTIESSRHPEEYKRKSEKLGYDDEHFNWLRAVGVRPKDIYDAASKGFNVSDYGNARKNGLSHEDYITKNAHKWYHEASNDDENFGLNEREQAKIKGKAIADYLWEGLENIFAPMGFGLQKKLETLKELEERFPNHTIKIEEDDDPYVSHKVGDWEGRYYGGPYIDLHHKKYGPMEVINLHNYETNENHKLTQNELHNEVEHFVKHDAQQYVDAEENHKHGAKKTDYDHIIDHRKGDPKDTELYSRIKSEAKEKFDVYPSAVANAWVVKEYKKRGGAYGKEKKKESSKWYLASADDDFGISKREQSEMVGHAMAEHIWEGMENIFGPIGLQSKLRTVTELEQRFPNHQIKIDDEDDPYVSHKVGDWEGRYYNGPYINMYHKKYGVQDGIHVGHDGDESKGNFHKFYRTYSYVYLSIKLVSLHRFH